MTKSQLEALWIQAGGRPASASLAAAVALAESSGNPAAVNYNTNGTVDRGLWQINSVHGGLSTFGDLANAKAAVEISGNGSNWSPWVTYNTGAYKQYLAGGGSPSPTPGPAAATAAGASSSSEASPSWLLSIGTKAFLYLAFIAGAAAMLWLGTKTALQPRKPVVA